MRLSHPSWDVSSKEHYSVGRCFHFATDVICPSLAKLYLVTYLKVIKLWPVWCLGSRKNGADPMKSVLDTSCLGSWSAVAALSPSLQNPTACGVILGAAIKPTWKIEGTEAKSSKVQSLTSECFVKAVRVQLQPGFAMVSQLLTSTLAREKAALQVECCAW